MLFRKINHRKKWMLLISGIVMFLVVNEVQQFFFSSSNLSYKLTHLLFSLFTIILLLALVKYTNKTTKELSESKQKLQTIFDTLDVAIWSHDIKEDTLLITPGIQKLYGHSMEEFYNDHELWRKVIPPEDFQVLAERGEALLEGQSTTSIYRIIRPDGEVRWIQDRGIPTLDEKKNLVDFTSVLFDITDRKESDDRYKSLVEMSPDIITVVRNEKVEYMNEAGSRLFGATSPSDIIGRSIFDFASPQIIEAIRNQLMGASDNKSKNQYEVQAVRIDGKKMELEISARNIMYGGRKAIQIVGRDISERKKAEKTIHQMAYYDALTGLPNRNMFRLHLNGLIRSESNQSFAILFLDLDRFKVINDTKGHTTGDLILREVAKRIEQTLRSDGVVFRQGGDEFIIILENMDKPRVSEVSQRMINRFTKPIVIDEQDFYVTPSIGISMYPDNGTDKDTLIKHADSAMYVAKEKGKNNFQFYHSNLDHHSDRKMELENALRKAIELNQLMLYYQPQVDLQANRMIGLEALIRWKHPEFGMVSPGEFIPIAEETGLIVPIGKWVLKEVCNQINTWHDEGLSQIPIAINISVRQIQDDHFIEDVIEILDYYNIDKRYIEFELTESIMQDIEKSTLMLKQLKQIGVKLAIDDFGTGYSSLSYLKHLPIDNIKIDKSFIDDILDESSQGSIVKAIIDMSQNLNFTVIAEGIEKEEQIEFLLKNGCFIGQGYYFYKPMPLEEIQYMLKSPTIKW
ncbi:EAL domain-containing protein [Bacillus salitolerans]|uniref:EAL domain-containing protein n=1 Tax=Bacillus salitolerans TaxID=1437434 RepID=A0ABW4LU30_9BACI